jgi:hypothetical protein
MSMETDSRYLGMIRQGLTDVETATTELINHHESESLRVLSLLNQLQAEARLVGRYLGIALDG